MNGPFDPDLTKSHNGSYDPNLFLVISFLPFIEPVVCSPPLNTDVVKYSEVELTCTVEYSGPEAPYLSWSGYDLGGKAVVNDTDEGKARSVSF